ncbi:glycosyltransferase [Priestia sp. GS2]|uniref:glycosyltransferase n=1 Tax=Priestia sp. GS2 TaxID=3117403 RepID=UPI002ED777D3
MLHSSYASFSGNEQLQASPPTSDAISNTFTIEFWVRPTKEQTLRKESRSGVSPLENQPFVIAPADDQALTVAEAFIAISVGTNGISVYEIGKDHFTPTLVYPCSIEGWTHVALVYHHRTPSLYVNGVLAKTGILSRRRKIIPHFCFGGHPSYGYFQGDLQEVRLWNIVRTEPLIQAFYQTIIDHIKGHMIQYWPLCEETTVQSCVETGAHVIENPVKLHKKKLLFTFYIPSGGVETLNRQRFYALSESSIQCDFLYTQPGTGLQNKVNASVFVTNEDVKIKEIISKENYDAIIVNTDYLLLKRLRQLGYKGHLIYEVQGLGTDKEYTNAYLKGHAHSYIKNYSDAILYPNTPHLIGAFQQYLSSKQQFCFHNCFDTRQFHYQPLPKQPTPIIGWVGRLEDNKNWRDFLRIGSHIIKHSADVKLWMFEDNTLSTPAEREAFECLVDQLNLRSHLTIYANQPHAKMAEYFSIIGDSGGFLCSTSKVEGFGYAVLEAMVCKCPVLSTDSDGVKSFIIHNQTGKFFTLGNIEEAVKEGIELLTNKSLRETIRHQGVTHIIQHFSPQEYAANFKQMLSQI